ncbi:MAG: DUF4386 family protein [Gemmatimonadaceae bacterium]
MPYFQQLAQTKRVGTGVAFIVFPLIFVFAFAVHPGLRTPHAAGPAELVQRALHNPTLQFGHALVTLNTALLVVVALHFTKLLEPTPSASLGFAGGALAVLGALMLAADKGALCLTLSGLDALPPADLQAMMPGLLAIFAKQGWLVLLWGVLLLPIGFALQAVALFRSRAIPRWQSCAFLIGVLFIAVPDGMEIVNLGASILLALAFLPYGLQLIRGVGRSTGDA